MIIGSQKVYYRFQYDKALCWKVLQAPGTDIEVWCEKKLEDLAYQDSDGDYKEYIELDIDGSRYFAMGYFNGWYYEDDEHGYNPSGSMNGFDFFPASEAHNHDKYLKPHRYSPYRDYIHLNSRIFKE